MSRSLVLSNSRLFVNFDADYRIRDVYFPRLGIENHTAGHAFRWGIWLDGAMHWIGHDWSREVEYEERSLVGRAQVRNEVLGIDITVRDAVDFEVDVLCREFRLHDRSGQGRPVRLILHHDFHISGSDVGDTAHYDPDLRGIIHYKRDRYFLIRGGRPPEYRFDGFATGKKRVGGAEGTWRDAEGDGTLSGNAIAQGAVDSTVSVDLQLPARGAATAYVWFAVAERYGEILQLDAVVRKESPLGLIERTRGYWQLWLENSEPPGVPEALRPLYATSLLVMRAHVDRGGAVIASLDSDITQFARDTYGYVWPRDGALAAMAFDRAGYPSVSRRFFRFAAALLKKEGYFLHKYQPDRSLASSWHPWVDEIGRPILPIQEDETALVIWALWRHFERFSDVEEVQPMYRSLIVRAADFLDQYRDPVTGLPMPSWDLWEERRGVFTYTCAAVWAGLDAASRLAQAFGDVNRSVRFGEAASEVRDGVLENLWDQRTGRFLRMLVPSDPERGRPEERDATPDASLFGLHFLGMLDEDDPRLVATLDAIVEQLTVRTAVGGMARYRGDAYHAVGEDWDRVPGNPWFVAQCWWARWKIARAETVAELEEALTPLAWVAERALRSQLLPEQLHPYSGAPLSVTPLTWSHAAFVSAVHDYLDRRAAFDRCPTCGAIP